jgi:hypothetical protein
VRRFAVIAALATLTAAVVAAGAQAALFLLFSRTVAEPGEFVLVRTGGNGALLAAKRRGELRRWPVRVFMVQHAAADSVRSPRDRRLTLLGRLNVDRKGDGRLRFRTPNLPPGDYTTVLHCVSCARYSNGRTIAPGGPWRAPFRIRPVYRDCDDSVYGDLGDDWQRRSVRAGPFWLVGVRGYGPQEFAAVPGRPSFYRTVKVLLLIDKAVTATIAVPPESRGLVGIQYDSRSPFWNAQSMRVRNGRYAMTFEGCSGSEIPHTQFNGGFVVAGPRCARLEVAVKGRTASSLVAIPFGAAC